MSDRKFYDSALLSHDRNKKSDNSPDFFGYVEFSEETIRFLASRLRDGEEPKLRIAVWRKSNDRGTYLSMQLSEPREGGGGGRGRGGEQRGATRRRDDSGDSRRSGGGRGRSDDRDNFNQDLDDEIPF